MKHHLFRKSLSLLRSLAALVQIGNPAGHAPHMLPAPEEANRIRGPLAASHQIYAWRLKQVLCCGLYSGAVITKENHIYQRFTAFPWGRELHPSLTSPYLGHKRTALEKAVFLLTPRARGNYYHWLTDLLPRLLLLEKSCQSDLAERMIILHQPARPYETDSLRMLGISEERIVRIHPFETVQVNDLLLTDYLHSPDGQYFPVWKKSLLDNFKIRALGSGPHTPFRKLYLLRGKQRIRQLLGEELLVEKLREAEFEIVDPQQLSLLQQMMLLAEATVVVGLHGAALTNCIFCQPGTLLVELRSSHKPPEHYAELARTYQLQFEAVSLEPQRKVDTPILALKQHLHLSQKDIDNILSRLQLCQAPSVANTSYI